MRAIILNEAGSADKLIYQDIEKPVLNGGEMLVKTKDIGMNPMDVHIRSNEHLLTQFLGSERPAILGWDISGEVVAKANDVIGFDIGDAVFGITRGKGYAEYVAAKYSFIMKGLIFLLCILCFKGFAQTPVPLDSLHWQIAAKEAGQEEYMGKKCLKLTNGSAILKNVNFLNGIIEFDIALQRAYYFPGIAFRVKDDKNAEYFYLRPHLSGNPDAVQYYPEYNYSGGWQLYYGEGYTNAHVLPVDRWLHIKMLIKGSEAEVYFDDENDPVLFINKLLRPIQAGRLVLDNTLPATAWFANFSYTATDTITLKSKPRPFPPLAKTVFRSWEVSDPLEEKMVQDKALLTDINTSALHWHHLPTDDRGVADLSILSGIEQDKNTVFAKLIIESDKEQTKKFTFGFSDRARLYFNSKLLYAGADNFLSRDYRFLGTMGYYDAVYLDLKKGRNEVWIAVSENEGGWGVMAKLEELAVVQE